MTQFVFVKFAFLETTYIVHSLNEMLQSVTKMLTHLEQKGHLQTSPDSQEEIWYKKKKNKKKKKKTKAAPFSDSMLSISIWYCCWAEMYYVGSHDGQFSVVMVTCLNYLFASGCDILMKASLSVSLYLCRIIKKFIFAFSRWSVFHHL